MKHSEGSTETAGNIDSDLDRAEGPNRFRRAFDEFVAAPARILWNDWRARIGSLLVLGYLLMGMVAWVSSADWWLLSEVTLVAPPRLNAGPRYLAPFQSLRFPLGTDSMGQGVFAQIVHATPAMLKMILAGALFGTTFGILIGVTAGYKGGRVDAVLMWFSDVMMTIPGLPLIIILSAVLAPRNPFVVGIVLTINDWAGLSRALRSQVLTIRGESYVEASRTLGLSTPSILVHDVVPNLMPYVTVNFVGMARSVIFASVGLYFLGILPFSTLNWGVMMNLAYNTGGSLYTLQTAHWLFFPMLAIVLLSLALILLAQGADRIFNPRIRARHEQTNTADEVERAESETSGPAITESIR